MKYLIPFYFLLICSSHTFAQEKNLPAKPAVASQDSSKSLREVNIVAQKPFIAIDKNKIILSIDKNKVAGQSVADILKKAPGITIQNNIILFEGRPITAQMKGKTIHLTLSTLTDFLGATAATTINEIEIITVPLSNVDASATSAIINLKPAKILANGYNANLNLKIGTRSEFGNGGIGTSVNFKHNKLSGLAAINYSRDHQLSKEDVSRNLTPTEKNKTSLIHELNSSKSQPENIPLSLSLEYALSPRSQIGTVVNALFSNTPTDRYNTSSIFLHPLSTNVADSLITMPGTQKKQGQSGAIDLYYRLKLDTAGQELNFNTAYSKGHSTFSNSQDYDYFLTDGSSYQTTSSLNQSSVMDLVTKSIQVDYTKPIRKIKLESGLKYGWTSVNQNLHQTITNPNGSTQLNDEPAYDENIFAGYVNLSGAIGNTSYSIGVRGENTAIKSFPIDIYGSINRSYFEVFPTLLFSRRAGKSSFVLSYKRSIERPRFSRLTNFKYYMSPFYYYTGNPGLQPYFQNATRFSWTFKNKFQVVASYTWYKNNMLEYAELDTINNVTRGLIANNGDFKSAILNPNYFANITQWWYTNTGFRIMQRHLNFVSNQQSTSLDNTNFSVNTSNTFTLSKSVKCELYAYYNSPTYYSASKTGEFYFVDVSIFKNVLKGMGQLSLSVSDIFFTNISKSDAQYALISYKSSNNWDSRNVLLGFNYRFGSKSYKSNQLKKSSATDDIKSRSY
ncbi:outer membrane beta-barrel family protein [Chitinophaga flava]|uniref:Outer membrane protein beta-barrel domain-containing protein n=1 Tax=Chitinophaga flava TaxID=2259036 RepID=A0A365XWL7_9BACT|nr:outer membrane beta-barrel family protein [Chitinophaga flava]RBL90094.1 hypothetical protein DF182_26870 [Chitinophaga flava]